MSPRGIIEAEAATGGVISTRNGVPPASTASDPPGGVPRHPDPDPRPHQPGEPQPQPEQDLPADEPPHTPPRREAHERDEHETRGNHRNHHGKHK